MTKAYLAGALLTALALSACNNRDSENAAGSDLPPIPLDDIETVDGDGDDISNLDGADGGSNNASASDMSITSGPERDGGSDSMIRGQSEPPRPGDKASKLLKAD